MSLIEHFRRSARHANAASVELFNQAPIAFTTNLHNGACYGLVLHWLRYWRRNPTANHARPFFRQAFTFAGARSGGGGDDGYMTGLNTLHHAHQTHYRDVDALRNNGGHNVLQQVDLLLNHEENFDHGPLRWLRAGRYIANHAGHYMVTTPSHAMGAINAGNRVVFFDPNVGEARFNAGGQLRSFMRRYGAGLGNRYRGRHDGVPHRSIHLSLRRYRGDQ